MAVPSFGNPGLNSVGEFQRAGQPFLSGAINATSTVQIDFPYVTKFIMITNHSGSGHCRVAFSANGLAGTNYYRIDSNTTTPPLEIMCRSIWLSGSSNVDIIAGLTGIKHTLDTNWSGSTGVG